MGVWDTICTRLASSQICAMVTILQTRGSAPREAGVRMIVLANGGFSGTIGGGALEWEAIAMARAAIRKTQTDGFVPTLHQSQQALGPDLGQCCGGSVSLLLEVFEPDRLAELSVLAEAEKAGAFETESKIKVSRVERSIIAADDPARGLYLQTLVYFTSSVQNAFQLDYYPDRFADTPNDEPSAQRRGIRRLRETWKVIDDQIGDNQWVLGERFSAVDIYLFMLITWLDSSRGQPSVGEFPNVKRIANAVQLRKSVQTVYKEWIAGDP